MKLKLIIPRIFSILFCSLVVLFFTTCGTKDTGSDSGKDSSSRFLPSASGLTGEVILVMDSAKWKGELGETIRQIYRSAYEGLPQNEPHFNLKWVSPRKFNSVLKKVRNLIFVTVLEGRSYEDKLMRSYFTKGSLEAMKTKKDAFFFQKKDMYAKGQQVVYLFNETEAGLVKKLKGNSKMLQRFSHQAEIKRLAGDMYKRRESAIEKKISSSHDFLVKVPKGFSLAKNNKNFVWLRMIEPQYEKNLFVYHRPYKKETVFEDIALLREEITQTYIRDIEKPELYLTYQEKIPFKEKEVTFKGGYAKKVTGLWKLSDISAGGPFLSYVFVNEKTQQLYYIEGYTYAPSMKKRNFMLELEVMLNSFSFSG